MWAYKLVSPRKLAIAEAQSPKMELRESNEAVILRMLAGGICGSDIPHFSGLQPLAKQYMPVISGPGDPGFPLHEVVGEVVSTNCAIPKGTRVVGWAPRNNGLAEYTTSTVLDVVPYDRKLKPTEAVMIQPLACVLDALERISFNGIRSAAVIGLGAIGLLFTKALKTSGVKHVIGVDRVDRSPVARVFGIDELVNEDSSIWATGLGGEEDRPQLVVEAVGHQVSTISDAIRAVMTGGTVLYFGIPDNEVYPFPMNEFTRKNGMLLAGVTRHRIKALQKSVAYLAEHRQISEIYNTAVYGIGDVQKAFDSVLVPSSERIKVILDYL